MTHRQEATMVLYFCIINLRLTDAGSAYANFWIGAVTVYLIVAIGEAFLEKKREE